MANDILKQASFHHVALRCSNIEKSLAMYKALGMKEMLRWGEGEKEIVMLDIGNGGRLELFANGSDFYSENGKWQHVALAVEDVGKAFNLALDIGFVADVYPKIAPLNSTPYKTTFNVAFVKGPDGESLEFFKEL